MPKWYHMPTSHRMTYGEYRANIDGINMVFGAALGFVLARSENMAAVGFVWALALSAGCVIAILYLSFSPYKLFYGVLTAFVIAMLPGSLEGLGVNPLPKLQPLLAVWAVMVLVLEVLPRDKATDAKDIE